MGRNVFLDHRATPHMTPTAADIRPPDAKQVERSDRWAMRLWVLTAATVPFSVKVYAPGMDLEVVFPAEPLLAVMFFVTLLRLARPPRRLVTKALQDPVVVLVLAYLCISTVTTVVSSMPMVSLKALVVRAVYITTLFIGPVFVFRNGSRIARKVLGAYAFAFLPIALFALSAQSQQGFMRFGAADAAFPFYNDHTHFAAALTFALFFHCGLLWRVVHVRDPIGNIVLRSLLVSGLALALYFSFCRAAWVAVIIAMALHQTLRSWSRLRVGAAFLALFILSLFVLRVPIAQAVQGNRSVADGAAVGTGEVIRSMSNVTNDVSNVERLHRWKAAYAMFLERPWSGFGPATYQFHYTAFLADRDTSIAPIPALRGHLNGSSMAHARNGLILRESPRVLQYSSGSAHSEYLMELTGSGLGGMVILALLACSVLYKRFNAGRRIRDPGSRQMRSVAFLGLTAYFIHSLFNNFLDDPKVAVPFWSSLAMLTFGVEAGRTEEDDSGPLSAAQ